MNIVMEVKDVLKEERMAVLLKLIDERGTVNINDLVEIMNVSDMTIRRDLSELAAQGKIRRIHGGAKSANSFNMEELSHERKKILQQDEKREIAQKAVALIDEEDTLFLGPGTSIELLAGTLDFDQLRIITNSLPVFNILKNSHKNYDVYLIGGRYRNLTGAFFGDMANKVLQDIRFSKSFVGANAVYGNQVMTASMEEGVTQSLAINNASQRYLCVDNTKFDREDFYTFYQLTDLTAVITSKEMAENLGDYQKYVEFIV